jgi:hypothetical protein
MKKYYVYELMNLMGSIEYVGESINPYKRFYSHTKYKPGYKNQSPSYGKFYGRCDLVMNIVNEFESKKEAFHYQCELQKYYGLETDGERMKRVFSNECREKLRNAKLGIKRGPYKK